MTAGESAELELVRDARARRSRRLDRAETIAKGVPAVAFVAAAASFALAAGSTRVVDGRGLALVGLFAVLSRLEFEVGSGSAVPTQLAFVPMLFFLPLPLVPVAVAVGYVAGAAIDTRVRGRAAWRLLGTIGCSWFAFPPALILWLAGEPGPMLRHWPIFVAAFASQVAADAVHTLFHERIAHGLGWRALWRPLAYTYGFDSLLTPLGVVAAHSGGWAFLALLPLLGVFEILERERRRRFDALAEAARLGRLATTDDLTGLANRRRFDEVFSGALARSGAGGVTLCLFDLDHFKAYNDVNGHVAGDTLLRDVAQVWRELVPSEALLARLGGEEFALIIESNDTEANEEIAERVRSATPAVTCSAGVAHRMDETRPAELMNRADAALYAAKAAGRCCLRVERRVVTRRLQSA